MNLKLQIGSIRKYRGGNFKVEQIFFGFPGGSPGGVPEGFQGAVRASPLANKSQDKTPGVFFHAAFDVDAPGPRNKPQKPNITKKRIY